jgi:hypothetical protein
MFREKRGTSVMKVLPSERTWFGSEVATSELPLFSMIVDKASK